MHLYLDIKDQFLHLNTERHLTLFLQIYFVLLNFIMDTIVLLSGFEKSNVTLKAPQYGNLFSHTKFSFSQRGLLKSCAYF